LPATDPLDTVSRRRRYVLGGAFVVATLLAAAILADVVGTVFFAITVAYLLSPLRRRLVDAGLSSWVASTLATAAAFLGTVLAVSPLVIVLFLRLEALLELLSTLPEEVTVPVLGVDYTVTVEQALVFVEGQATALASTAATAVPVLLIKATLFAFLLFSLLYNEERLRLASLAVVPREYRDVARRLDARVRETLFGIYVLQAATAMGTFLIALPVFYLLGYRVPFALATVSAVLQFVPIVGPSVVIVSLALYHVVIAETVRAALVFVVGGILIAWLPDVLIRPRLANETAQLPGGLYFVGFVGGLLTLGPVGVIAGPLAVALVVELSSLLSSELNDVPVTDEGTGRATRSEVDVGTGEADLAADVDAGPGPGPDPDEGDDGDPSPHAG
jgi:predicted PurR-regulated permease PerM